MTEPNEEESWDRPQAYNPFASMKFQGTPADEPNPLLGLWGYSEQGTAVRAAVAQIVAGAPQEDSPEWPAFVAKVSRAVHQAYRDDCQVGVRLVDNDPRNIVVDLSLPAYGPIKIHFTI